jgi:tryptophan synthase alpha chain
VSAERLRERLESLRASGRKGLAPYVTAGDGGMATTVAVLRALDRAGAACVELGVPFSDPIADGPILQAAAERALAAGTTLDRILEAVRVVRAGSKGAPPSEMPIVLFSYANPLVRRGWKQAALMAADAGIDGWLVPDLPVEEAEAMRSCALEEDLAPIFFVAPTTSETRIRAAASASRGFLYAIGRFGVTGARTGLDERALAFLARVRAMTELPLAVGFGIQTCEQVQSVLKHADLAVVGSALVQHIHEACSEWRDEGKRASAAAGAARALFDQLATGLRPVDDAAHHSNS